MVQNFWKTLFEHDNEVEDFPFGGEILCQLSWSASAQIIAILMPKNFTLEPGDFAQPRSEVAILVSRSTAENNNI